MRVLLTGGTGFIGRHFLKGIGEDEVLLLTRDPSAVPDDAKQKKISVLQCDLAELAKVEKQLIAFDPECCVHLAWEALPDYSQEMCEKNRILATKLFNFIEGKTKCKRIVSTGTAWEYTERSGALNEDDRNDVTTDFTQAKKQLYNCGMALANTCDMEFIWLRLFEVYGPHQKESSLLQTLAQMFRADVPAKIEHPEHSHDFVYVEDVADALWAAARGSAPNGAYNVGSGKSTQIGLLAGMVEEKLRGSHEFAKTLALETNGKTENYWADLTKSKEKLKWEPKVTLSMGIDRFLAATRSTKDSYLRGNIVGELERTVLTLFRRLDEKDYDSFLELFAQGATIVHPDGASTTPQEFIAGLRKNGMRLPKGRTMTNFHGGGIGDWGWVAYLNRAEFANENMEFTETAILQDTPEGWRFLRIHYNRKTG